MERKQKFEIGLAIAIIIALICVLVWILYQRSEDSVVLDQNGNIIIDESGEVVVPTIDYSVYPESASTIARVFAERFGSFSNQADYQNVLSVMDIATESLRVRLDEIIDSANGKDSNVYYGVSTHILSVEQVSATEAQEVFEILTQREESIESPQNTTVRYQTMVLTLVKSGDYWLVDDFVWE